MHSVHEVSDFYAQNRDYWIAMGSKASAPPTVMLNFGYWSQGVDHLYEAQQSLVRRIIACIPPCKDGAQGVEVGCGIGGISINVLQQLPHVRMTGVDIAEGQLALARANAQAHGVQDRFHPQQGDSMALPLQDGAFDFGLCIESSFHYDNKPSFFGEIFRALRPGGSAVVADITCSRVEGVRFRQGNHFESAQTYHGLIRDAGFELVSTEDIGPQVYGPLYQHVHDFNAGQSNRNRISKYWSLVLNNYRELAREGDMGYHIFVMKKPEAPGAEPLKRFPRWLARGVARLDYGFALPLLAWLPTWLARPLWVLRGCVNHAMDWDWRTLSLGHGYVREATEHTMAQLCAQAGSDASPQRLTRRRFVCMSREEVQAVRLSRLDRATIDARITGLEPLLKARDRQQGIVLMTAHFDSLYMGLAALAQAGLTVNLMSTKLTDDAMVPPAISRHFATKAAALNRLLAPGRVTHFEDSMRFFVSALRRGEIVVIACDGPSTSQDRSQPVDFLGERRRMASGPQFLARAGAAPLALYTCQEGPLGHFAVEITEPTSLEEGGLQRAYTALEGHLRAHPWQWWAADLYRTYVPADATAA